MKRFIVVSTLVLAALFALAPVALAQEGPSSAVELVDLLNMQQAWVVAVVAGILGSLTVNFLAKMGWVPQTLTDESRHFVMTAVGIVIPLVWTPVFAWLYDLANLLDAKGLFSLGAMAVSVAYSTHLLSKSKTAAVLGEIEDTVEELDKKYAK